MREENLKEHDSFDAVQERINLNIIKAIFYYGDRVRNHYEKSCYHRCDGCNWPGVD